MTKNRTIHAFVNPKICISPVAGARSLLQYMITCKRNLNEKYMIFRLHDYPVRSLFFNELINELKILFENIAVKQEFSDCEQIEVFGANIPGFVSILNKGIDF